MGLFQKNSARKLFSSSFAIDADETVDDTQDSSDVQSALDHQDDVVDQVLGQDVMDADFEPVLEDAVENDAGRSLSIAQIIQLVRSLPQQGTETELHAVLRTLELFHVDVEMVLEDSYRKEALTSDRIDTLLSEISTLDEEIDKRAKEIKMLEMGLTEMVRVNECLELMLKLDHETADTALASPALDDKSVAYPDEPAQAEPEKAQDDETSLADDSTESDEKSAAQRLDEYVKNGETQTLDGIVIDLDAPPKKVKIAEKSKSKRRRKRAESQEA